MRRARSRVLLTLPLLASLVALAGGRTSAQQVLTPCTDPNRVVIRDGWTVVRTPTEMPQITAYAVHPRNRDVLYVTDGRSVLRTIDGGCTWAPAFSVTGLPPLDLGLAHTAPTIKQIVVPDADRRIYLTLEDAGSRSLPTFPQVMASFDDGDSWTGASGLPAIGIPLLLRVTPDDSDRMYLSIGGPAPGFYVTVNAGRTWQERSQGTLLDRFAVDPGDAEHLWGVNTAGTGGPYRSGDGGRTWHAAEGAPRDGAASLRDVAIAHDAGGPVVLAPEAASSRDRAIRGVWRSSDDGATFTQLPADGLKGPFGAFAVGDSPDDIYVATARFGREPATLLFFDSKNASWEDADTLRVSPLDLAATVGPPGVQYWFRGRNVLAGYRRPLPTTGSASQTVADTAGGATTDAGGAAEKVPPPPAACLSNGPLKVPDTSKRPQSVLTPNPLLLRAQPSVPQTIPYKLSVPAVPGKLDVYFLLDSSGSMQSAVDGVVCGLEKLVNDLSGSGLDVQLGMGQFQDSNGLRYRRDVDIAPPGAALQRALRSIKFNGGEEAHRSALYQTATGAGLQAIRGSIPPGQQAHFRPDALEVVIMITDEPYTITTPQEPSEPDVITSMLSRDIHHVGILVYGQGGGGSLIDGVNANNILLRGQLDRFSAGTKTFAPSGGVDCDGDKRTDLPPGAPLVCAVPRRTIEANLGETLTNVLLALSKDQTVTLRALETSGTTVSIAPPQRLVKVNSDHTGPRSLAYDVTFTCHPAHDGTTRPVTLGAFAGAAQIATGNVGVACGVQPVPAAAAQAGAPPPPDRPQPVPVLNPPPPPPVVPVAAPVPAPAQAPAAGNAPVSANANQLAPVPPEMVPAPGAALGYETEERRQLAEVRAYSRDSGSGVRTAGAAALVAGFGAAAIRRRRAGSRVRTVRSR